MILGTEPTHISLHIHQNVLFCQNKWALHIDVGYAPHPTPQIHRNENQLTFLIAGEDERGVVRLISDDNDHRQTISHSPSSSPNSSTLPPLEQKIADRASHRFPGAAPDGAQRPRRSLSWNTRASGGERMTYRWMIRSPDLGKPGQFYQLLENPSIESSAPPFIRNENNDF
ncbi:hypothetical protein TNCT_347241 [Trichonephila clavata]|uniref:Uncharacterized protein n=1 Tax=Trichonephila clavata TaxID=2740835 RepID=A0A8X6KWN1_TRICU|nr:hypothetical protein TNCT_347241 [Trichonephila clavata]